MFGFNARGDGSRPAPRGLQKVLSAETIQALVRRESSRADRTGRQLSVVLFRVKRDARRRWTVATCRIARVLLSRVRQTDDVGWFDDHHLCALLPDTPATGARVFAARACDEIGQRQPRPLWYVYGYPGTFVSSGEPVEVHAATDDGGDDHLAPAPSHGSPGTAGEFRSRRINGGGGANGHANGQTRRNGHGGHGANGHHSHGFETGNGDVLASLSGGGAAVALAEDDDEPEADADDVPGLNREQLEQYFLDGVSAASAPRAAAVAPQVAKAKAKPDAAIEDLFAQPMPLWKRCLDLTGATVGLVMLSPVLLAAAAAIKLTSPGPVIFKQKRSGLGGKPFTIFKFRTMCVGAEKQQAALRAVNEQDGPAFKLTNDPRVTRVGHLLRKTSIDELPQLLNVIKGDMSLVGPRPLPVKEQDGCLQWQRHRLNVTPGLTCIWQVDGRSEVSFDEWVRMDVKYMRNQSLWHDLSILFRTVPSVLLRRGAR